MKEIVGRRAGLPVARRRLLGGVGGAFLAALTPFAKAAMAGPPLAGGMANFIPLDPPRPIEAVPFADNEGRSVQFADFRGRVLFVNFWATWCPPCVREMPTISRLQARLGGPDFQVIAISLDQEGAAKALPFLIKEGLDNLTCYVDPTGEVATAMGIPGLPTSIVLDREGRAVGTLPGPAEWDSPEAVALMEYYMAL